ncbi:conserved hypothetical protein [Beutenbergia cavernae DSM 12333]|uniref:DUF2330 domain-containing protein n=1 Tax=Beutenbergia cavernae (strain ATCC BAA-8 / DSM 12333 / CCUG 43141 / JCM 11478 / NBRC 16432 / NCIMB 13614 / HKI 0122) TaxID=471853 RepID=C5C5A9_BEUC1|nr:DUF2330 domain-containing protein [Beutenbergia cavernae]ACQ82249.1 conserved hypothetical protein [Beutenbergia cavernae DSM 12333]
MGFLGVVRALIGAPVRARRRALVAVGALVGAGALVVVPGPAQACGCGGVVTSEAYDVAITHERVLLQWDGSTERLLMELDAISDAPEAALLLPTPEPAEVELGDPAVLDALDEASRPEVVRVSDWWPEVGGFGLDGGAGGAPGDPGVDVLDQVDLGPVEATTLAARDAGALTDWLDENGYVLSAGLESALVPYVAEGWSYVAVRLTPEGSDAVALTGELQPLQVTFGSDTFVYPMRLSSAAEDTQRVRTYVLAPQRTDRVDDQAGDAEVRFAGEVSAQDWPALADVLAENDGSAYLTTTDQTFTDPPTQIYADFVFAPSSGGDVREVETIVVDRVILGLPAGWVLVVLGVGVLGTGAVLGVAAVQGRRRRARLRA